MTELRYKIMLLIVVLLLITHFFIGIDTISHLSPTFDEPIHLTVGYSYLETGKYDNINIYDHPPAAEMYAAIPIVFMYRNKVKIEKMLNPARIMILLLSCFLGFITYLWAKQLYGVYSGIFALVLYVFSSEFIAHGTVVTTDLAVTLFNFLSIYIFWCWLNNQRIKTTIFLALSTALALTTKFSGTIVLCIYLIFLLLPQVRKRIKLSKKQFIGHMFLFLVLIVIFILIIYRFRFINLFIDGLINTLREAKFGHPSFLLGQHSKTGWIYYFVVTFLLKTPISLLILIFLCLVVNRRRLIETNTVILLLPAIIYFIVASMSRIQIGNRYILCIYPFIFVGASRIVSGIKKNKIGKIFYFLIPVFCFLLIWYVGSCMKIHPWHLSYFNEFVGGSENGYKYLTDSNIDWGQGLKELGKWHKSQNLKGVYLSYFGTGDPHYYGIKYMPVKMLPPEGRSGDNIVFSHSDRIVFAISMTNFQSTYYADKKTFYWLKQYKPDKIVANSILIYELTKRKELLKDFEKYLEIKQMK